MPAAPGQISSTAMVTALKAAAEPTRLRILALLATSALSVKDLTRILGQSQPRLSRHLKLLTEAGLVERAPEGSWVYFHLADGPSGLAREMLSRIDAADPIFVRDRQRAVTVHQERQAEAQSYFAAQAANWDRIPSLHVAESEVEPAMRDAVAPRKVDLLVDLGTGTVRMLELFADRYSRCLGFDLSRNGKLLALSNNNGRIEIWDVDTGKRARVLHDPKQYSDLDCVAFSSTSVQLAAALRLGRGTTWNEEMW